MLSCKETGDTASNAMVLGFTGDVCLGLGMRHLLEKNPPDFPFANVMTLLRSVDLLVGNLECCLVDERASEEMRARPMAVPQHLSRGIREAGFHAMSLANNHILDCGLPGLGATLEYLESLGVRCFGAGFTVEEAHRPALFEWRGRRILLLGAADFSRVHAGPRRAGVAPMCRQRLGRLVRDHRDSVDLVVVSLHADLEFSAYPSPARVRLSRWLIDQGASIVVQHHPHVCQGIEEYNHGLIAYSLGNFVFHVHGHPYLGGRTGTAESMLWKVHADFRHPNPRLSWECVPLWIEPSHRPVLPPPDRAVERLNELRIISDNLQDMSFLRRYWRRRCLIEGVETFYDVYYASRRGRWQHTRSGLMKLATSHEDRRWIVGLLTQGRI